jgi:DNA-damage-inducible protein J
MTEVGAPIGEASWKMVASQRDGTTPVETSLTRAGGSSGVCCRAGCAAGAAGWSGRAGGSRIDADLKRHATAALASMGLTISDAIRLLLVRVAAEKALPFDVRTPNATTRAAIAAAERGELTHFESVDALLADLHD